jgi:hypothetical protein
MTNDKPLSAGPQLLKTVKTSLPALTVDDLAVILNAAKAYAAQQCAEKDKRIEELTQQVALLREAAAGARHCHTTLCSSTNPMREPWICDCGAEDKTNQLRQALTTMEATND